MSRKPTLSNSLAKKRPDLARQWHPTLNHPKTPKDVFPKSEKPEFWWKCLKGHEYEASTKSRSNGLDCKTCKIYKNSIIFKKPNLLKEWHPTKNNSKKPGDFNYGSKEKIWWKCYEGKWQGGKKEGDKADDHEWEATLHTRSNGRGCRVCRGEIAVPSNCLKTTNPKISKQWHSSIINLNSKKTPLKLNGNKTPNNFTAGSNEKIWWKCDQGDDHVWNASIKDRSKENGNGCPVCSGNRVVPSNCLVTTNSDIAKQWCIKENSPKNPLNFTSGSNEVIIWQCPYVKSHKWKAKIKSRTHPETPTGCEKCSLPSYEEIRIFCELKIIFKEIINQYKRDIIKPGHHKNWTFDFYIPGLYLVIDYDGNFWHKDKFIIDKLKTELFKETKVENSNKKYKAFRIREQTKEFRLSKITEDDIEINHNSKDKIKTIVNNVLKKIMEMFPKELSSKNIEEINYYIEQNELQNTDEYTRKIKELEIAKARKKKKENKKKSKN